MSEQHDINISGSVDVESPLDGPNSVTPTTSRMTRHSGSVPDLAHILAGITAAVCAAVPGADFASITRHRKSHEFSPDVTTHLVANELEKLQTHLRQGPGAAAVHGSDIVAVRDMSDEHRWPIFARQASALGVGSMLSFRLSVQEHDPLGVLHLYAAQAQAFTADDEVIGGVFAVQAANALYGATQRGHLGDALVGRDEIEQAKGILMVRYHLSADQAFDVLQRASQAANRRLADVARELIERDERLGAADRSRPYGRAQPGNQGAPAHGLRVTRETIMDVTWVCAVGEVDLNTTANLAEQLRVACGHDPSRRAVVLDLSGVRFFAAAGLTVLMTTRQQCRARQIGLHIIANRSVLRPLQLTGLRGLFDVVSAPEHAVDARSGRSWV